MEAGAPAKEGTVIGSIPCPIAVVGLDGKIVEANGALCGLLRMGAEDLAGTPVEMVLEDGGRAGLLRRLVSGERVRYLRLRCIVRGSAPVPVSISGSEMARPAEAPRVFVLVFEDLSEMTTLESELEKTRGELERRVHYIDDFRDGVYRMLKDIDSSEKEIESLCLELRDTQNQLIQSSKLTALGELAAGLAHELNQPLTVIKGLSRNILKTTYEDSAHYEKLKLIVEASGRMEQIINHLRVFSRRDEPVFAPIDLNSVIKDAFIIIKEILQNHAIETVFRLAGSLPPVLGNANRLEQVIINIASNAKDAMPEGGRLEVATSTVKAGGVKYARMSFRDNGCGMDREVASRIFDPFFTTKESGKGTGLGLSISYGIVKDHSGEITVESERGKGTAFHITIPAIDESG